MAWMNQKNSMATEALRKMNTFKPGLIKTVREIFSQVIYFLITGKSTSTTKPTHTLKLGHTDLYYYHEHSCNNRMKPMA